MKTSEIERKQNCMKRILRIRPTTLSAVVPLLLALFTLSRASAKEQYAMPKLNEQSTGVSREVRSATSFAPVIKKVAPSVVNIASTSTMKEQQFWHPFFEDPMFRRFFGDPGGSGRRFRAPRAQNLGSGVIVSEDGFILTNNHMVDGADEVKVTLSDGKTQYAAKVIGADPQTDIAVLKVDAKNLPAITITDSDKLEVGDAVLAIGNPFNVGQSVTLGIVSALGRDFGGRILGREGYEDFIQTDAAINPGNSGGALVDAEGRLVGINQSIVSGSGANAGVGFAVPINMAKNVMERLVGDGKIRRGFLGLKMQSLTPELAKEFALPDQNGVIVTEILPNTPAADAGIKEDDAIVEFNGKKVTDNRHLRLMVSQTEPDTKVTVKLIREGKPKTVTVKLGTLPGEQASVKPSTDLEQQELDALDGVEVADIDARARRQFDIPTNIRGALVLNVDEDSNAGKAGLRPGDVILGINRQAVRDADTAVELTKKLKSERLLLRVWSRDGDTAGIHYLPVDNGKRKK